MEPNIAFISRWAGDVGLQNLILANFQTMLINAQKQVILDKYLIQPNILKHLHLPAQIKHLQNIPPDQTYHITICIYLSYVQIGDGEDFSLLTTV